MPRFARLFLGCALFGILFGLAASAQEVPTRKRVLGLAPGAGYFFHPQYVDGGYHVNGQPYDLVWSGMQLQLSGDIHWHLAKHPFLGFGAAGAFMLAPNATGADSDHTVSVDPDKLALGGYLAFSTCFRLLHGWRLKVLTGLGRNGMSGALGFGGWGPAFGVAAHRMFGSGALASGVGLRLDSMALFSSRDGMVRGESGLYVSLLLEVLFELAHDVPVDQGETAPRQDQGGGVSGEQPW